MNQKIDFNAIMEEINQEMETKQNTKTHLSQSDIRLLRKNKKTNANTKILVPDESAGAPDALISNDTGNEPSPRFLDNTEEKDPK